MDLDLKGNVAIVTGGARGIGRSIVLTLAQEGCQVVICDLFPDAAEATAEEVKKLGVEAMAYKMDVSKLDEASNMAKAVVDRFDKIDILVNNAGTNHRYNFWESGRREWEADIESCLYGTLCCSRAVIPYMMARKSGRIVNISSNAGRVGYRKEIGYVAAKAGIMGITKAMALELAPYGIAVNVVAPGFTMTEMARPVLDAEQKRAANMHPEAATEIEQIRSELWPLGRYGLPEDIAYMVVFLCSGKAARYITGQTISIDGGRTMI